LAYLKHDGRETYALERRKVLPPSRVLELHLVVEGAQGVGGLLGGLRAKEPEMSGGEEQSDRTE